MKFTIKDITQIEKKGIRSEKVEEQLEIFKRGNIPVDIVAAATSRNGIKQMSDSEMQANISEYEQKKETLKILKFIPASGAATRMFKALHQFLKDFNPEEESLANYLQHSKPGLTQFFGKLENLPFYKDTLNHARKNQPGFDSFSEDAKKVVLVKTMLFSPGLDLSNYPKGLVPFHKYEQFEATAFEEHLYEASKYVEVNGIANLHFTVSPEHKEKFEAEFEEIKSRVEKKTGIKFNISYSFQDPKTDTIAANDKNEAFRTKEGELFFRPGGHGALIENLNDQQADLVFIKNIDNVVTLSHLDEIAAYKKALAGKLLKIQSRCFKYLQKLTSGNPSSEEIEEMETFLTGELFVNFEDDNILSEKEKTERLKKYFNRPLRVCGMVKNEGEPGGGPFLVKMKDGSQSLQIIEGAQINTEDKEQQKLAQNATHFNPVDIVCGLKNYEGKKFDLNEFVDSSTSFIASKTKDGKPLKALELPGLWNGAMAYWNTVFVEVPVSTFNPVKTVADLLKPSHQVK